MLRINATRLLSRRIFLEIHLLDLAIPAKEILDLAQLDALESGEQLRADGAGLIGAFGAVGGRLVVGEARDRADGDECCGGAGGEDLGEGGELFVFDLKQKKEGLASCFVRDGVCGRESLQSASPSSSQSSLRSPKRTLK